MEGHIFNCTVEDKSSLGVFWTDRDYLNGPIFTFNYPSLSQFPKSFPTWRIERVKPRPVRYRDPESMRGITWTYFGDGQWPKVLPLEGSNTPVRSHVGRDGVAYKNLFIGFGVSPKVSTLISQVLRISCRFLKCPLFSRIQTSPETSW